MLIYSTRELKQRGRERRRERYKTIDLNTELQALRISRGNATTGPSYFSAIVFGNRTWKTQFWRFEENVNVYRVRIISIFTQLWKQKLSYSRTFRQNKKEAHELYK